MRILQTVHGFLPEATGGVELRCFYLSRELAKHHDVSIFCRTGKADLADYDLVRDEVDGLEVVRVNYNFGDCTGFEGIYKNERIERIFEERLDEFRPDVVHIHHLTCLSTGIPALLRRRGIPCVMSLHDFWLSCPRGQIIRTDLSICDPIERNRCLPCLQAMWPHFQWEKRTGIPARLFGDGSMSRIEEYDRWIREVLKTPDQMFAPCDFHREKFIELGVPADRIRKMAYGFDMSMFDGAAERREASDRIRVGYIGSVIPTKGLHVVLEAFEGIDPAKASLDIYGEIPVFHGDTTYRDRVDAGIREDRGIRIHGRYENKDLPDILAKIDVLVVPSVWYETFSITIREGWMAGIPVVASDLGAMGESIEHDVTGLKFAPGDAADLREKLQSLIDDAALRQRLIDAPKPIKSIEDNGVEIAGIYQELIDRAAATR